MTIINGHILNNEDLSNIATYMDDEIREHLHFELAPCDPEEFLDAYIREADDEDFMDILKNEFHISYDWPQYIKMKAAEIEAADTWTDDIIDLLRDLNEDCELGLDEADYETPGDFATAISKMTGLELGI